MTADQIIDLIKLRISEEDRKAEGAIENRIKIESKRGVSLDERSGAINEIYKHQLISETLAEILKNIQGT